MCRYQQATISQLQATLTDAFRPGNTAAKECTSLVFVSTYRPAENKIEVEVDCFKAICAAPMTLHGH